VVCLRFWPNQQTTATVFLCLVRDCNSLGFTMIKPTTIRARLLCACGAYRSQYSNQVVGVEAQVVVAMKVINEASRKISDIMRVIDGIAFQSSIWRSTPQTEPHALERMKLGSLF
jgi:hypothetical protein